MNPAMTVVAIQKHGIRLYQNAGYTVETWVENIIQRVERSMSRPSLGYNSKSPLLGRSGMPRAQHETLQAAPRVSGTAGTGPLSQDTQMSPECPNPMECKGKHNSEGHARPRRVTHVYAYNHGNMLLRRFGKADSRVGHEPTGLCFFGCSGGLFFLLGRERLSSGAWVWQRRIPQLLPRKRRAFLDPKPARPKLQFPAVPSKTS